VQFSIDAELHSCFLESLSLEDEALE